MDKINIYMIVILICGIGLGFCVSQIMETIDLKELIQEESNLIPMSEQAIINNCKNLSLQESANCLRNEIEPFFIYNVTSDKINLTFDEIKLRGGDCRDFSFLYERLASGLGFESDTNRYNGKKDVYPAHRWATIWDVEEGIYCRIDQLSVKCAEIDNEM